MPTDKTVEEIREILGADSLAYLRMERLPEICEGLPFCDACFSGNYPLEPADPRYPWRTGMRKEEACGRDERDPEAGLLPGTAGVTIE